MYLSPGGIDREPAVSVAVPVDLLLSRKELRNLEKMVLHRKHEPRVACPYCWEQVDIDIAEQIDQDFIVDCAVCCHPILVHIRTAGDGKHQIELRRENE